MTAKRLYIIRGLPGSGKTELSSRLSDYGWGPDDYFAMKLIPWDQTKVGEAMAWAIEQLANAMAYWEPSMGPLTFDAAFTQKWQMKAVRELAESEGWQVTVLTLERFDEKQSVHDVPQDTVVGMARRMEWVDADIRRWKKRQ